MKAKKRLELLITLVNQSQADLIMFCGHSLSYQYDIEKLKDRIENNTSFVLFEVREVKESNFIDLRNCLYSIENGSVHSLFTNQHFFSSGEIEGNEPLCERFIYELETRRHFMVKDLTFMVFQCGEINIIKNIQKEDNRPVFRLKERPDLEERLNRLLKDTHIILNPIHTPMGNQGKMNRRREYFSADNRFYFSASQNGKKRKNDEIKISINAKSLQYAYHNGKIIEHYSIETTNDYQKRLYHI